MVQGIRAAYDEAKKNGKEKASSSTSRRHLPSFSPRFLAIAEKNPEGPEAIDALKMTFRPARHKPDNRSKRGPRPSRSCRIIMSTKPQIKGLLKMLTRYDDKDSKALVADVIARNPDRKVQAAAYLGQVSYRGDGRRFAETVKNPSSSRRSKSTGKEFIEERSPRPRRRSSELDALKQDAPREIRRPRQRPLDRRPMPALMSEDLEGKTATLADLKGKVVVSTSGRHGAARARR